MDSSWLSDTSSEIVNYLYEHITRSGDEQTAGAQAFSSLQALSKGFWITDLPTNDFEPLENSPVAKELKREKELEEKIAALKAECEEKEQQLKKSKKNAFLAKGNFLKKKAEVKKLSDELQSAKEKERKLEATNSFLKEQLQELQEKSEIAQSCLSQKICALNHELAAFKSELAKYATEKEQTKTQMEIFKENEKKMKAKNASLKLELHEVQDNLDNSQLQEQWEVCSLNSQLAACNAELTVEAGEKERMKAEMEAIKECNLKLQAINFSLQQELNDLREKLNKLQYQQPACETELQKKASENKQLKANVENCEARGIKTLPSAVPLTLTSQAQAPVPLFNPSGVQLDKEDSLVPQVRNIKSVPPPTVPLFNPSEIQLGKEDTRKDTHTVKRNLPSKASDTKYLQPTVPPLLPSAPIPLFNPREIQLGKKDVLTAGEQNSASKQKVNPYRKATNARDTKPVQPPVTPPLPSSPIPLLNPREIQLGKKDALLAEEQNSSSKQKANPYRKSHNVRNIKSVPPPTVPLFNPSEIQLGKEDTRTASLTAQRTLPSKGTKIKPLIPPLPPSGAPPVPLYNPDEIQLKKKDSLPPEERISLSDHGGNPFRKATNVREIKPVQPPPPPPLKGAVPLLNPSEIQLERKDAPLAEEKNSTSAQKGNPFRKTANLRGMKPVQPPPSPPVKGAVPLFNPSEIQFEKKDAPLAEEKISSSAQGGNPFRKAANVRDMKPVQPPPLPPVKGAVPLFNPSEIQLDKKDALLVKEKNSSSAQGGNPFRKTANARDIKPVQPPPPPPVKGAVPLFDPSEIQLDKKDAFLAEEKNSSSAQGGNPFRKAANVRDIKPVQPPPPPPVKGAVPLFNPSEIQLEEKDVFPAAQPHHPSPEEGGNPLKRAVNGKGYPSLQHSVKPQYMQHPKSFNSMQGEGFVRKNVNPFPHIEERGFLRRSIAWFGF